MDVNPTRPSVIAVFLTHGDRGGYIAQSVRAALKDGRVVKCIVVDNASSSVDILSDLKREYGERVESIRFEENQGSAGGFHAGIARARTYEADFVYLSDDDMVPEEHFITWYLRTREFIGDDKVTVLGKRADLPHNTDIFTGDIVRNLAHQHTFFSVFSLKKVGHFLTLIFTKDKRYTNYPLVPIIPVNGFVYGGAFIPMEAVKKAPLPDPDLFLYGDDIEYSWGVEALGYKTYVATRPIIRDLESTFGSDYHIFGLYRKELPVLRARMRVRNMVSLSLKHSTQWKLDLYLSILIWTLGLLILGLAAQGPTAHYFSRSRALLTAIREGWRKGAS